MPSRGWILRWSTWTELPGLIHGQHAPSPVPTELLDHRSLKEWPGDFFEALLARPSPLFPSTLRSLASTSNLEDLLRQQRTVANSRSSPAPGCGTKDRLCEMAMSSLPVGILLSVTCSLKLVHSVLWDRPRNGEAYGTPQPSSQPFRTIIA